MRGRKPKPTALKRRQGNPGKRALNNQEPQPELRIPTCPSYLQDEARREWQRIVKLLFRVGLVTELDRAALAGYCSAYADYVNAEREVRKHGAVIKSDEGGQYQSPWISIKRRALDQVIKFGAEFGLTPSSRVRLKVEGQDTLEEKEKRLFPQSSKGRGK
jgi:P27 family predicted phage terminase small subunit